MIKLKVILIAILLVCVAVTGYFIYRYCSTSSHFNAVQLLPSPQPLINFTLENQNGNKFTAEDFKGHWNLVFFGFTLCPEMCPLELQALAKVLRMAEQRHQTPIQVIFISLDPERDSAQKIADYLADFHSSIVGLRGASSELVLLNKFFAIDYSRNLELAGSPLTIPAGVDIPADVVGDYQVEHSGRIFVIDPDGQYLGSFAQPHSAEKIWADLQLIIKR